MALGKLGLMTCICCKGGNASVVQSLDSAILCHKRLGHVSGKGLSELVKQGILGSNPLGNFKFCEHCIFGKHIRVKFTKSQHTITHAFDYVHSNLWGLAPIQSLDGCKNFLFLVDDCTKRV